MRRVNTSCLFLLAIALALSANAAIITPSTIGNGVTSKTVDLGGVTADFESNIPTEIKTLLGYDTLGQGSPVPGEISFPNWMKFSFSAPVGLENLSLGLYFADGYRDDLVNEQVEVLVDGVSGLFQVTSPTTATFSLPGFLAGFLITNPSSGNNDGAGVWSITPLAELVLSTLEIRGKCSAASPCVPFTNADGGLTSMDVALNPQTGVPEPGTLALMGFSLLGLVAYRQRRAKK